MRPASKLMGIILVLSLLILPMLLVGCEDLDCCEECCDECYDRGLSCGSCWTTEESSLLRWEEECECECY